MAENVKKISLRRNFDANPKDISVAFYTLARQHFGEKAITGFDRDLKIPVALDIHSIKISKTEEVQGVSGYVKITTEGFEGIFLVYEQAGIISCEVDEQHGEKISLFLQAVEAHIAEHSIFRGRAFTAGIGEFVDLSDVEKEPLIFNAGVAQELETHVWTLLKKPDQCRELGIKFRRKVLLAGPFGAGKTQIALLTASIAIAHGITAIFMPPSNKWQEGLLLSTLRFARKLEPAWIFIEDIDHEQRAGESYTLKRIQDEFDGICSKSDRIFLLLSSNYPGRIAGPMQRPGRIDHIIYIGKLDDSDIKGLIESQIPLDALAYEINWETVIASCRNYPPAFVSEVCTCAKLTMLSGDEKRVTEKMLVEAAKQLRSQFEACEISQAGGQYI